MAELSIVIPVLARPHRAGLVCSSIFENTQAEVEVYFVCSPGDDDEISACRNTGEEVIVVPWEAGPGDFAKKHNLAFGVTTAPYVLLGADDLEFEPGWEEKALRVAERSGAGVIGVNDDANPLVKRGRHATHPIVSRAYIEERGGTWHDGPGVVYCEEYSHQWVDNEIVAVAMERREWAFAADSIVRHLHPFYPKRGQKPTPMDDTYRRALEDGSSDQAIFIRRQKEAKRQAIRSVL